VLEQPVCNRKHAPLVVLLLERLHVLRDVATEDVFLQNLSIELLRLGVVARETLLVVGNVKATVRSTLEGTKDTRTSRCALETDIKVTLEWPRSVLVVERLSQRNRAIGLLLTLVLVSEAELGQGTAGGKETGGISCVCKLIGLLNQFATLDTHRQSSW
jgi:hypothetical protein